MKQLKITSKITSRDSYSVDKYLTEISRLPLLKEEDEEELARRIRKGDQAAIDKLIKSNLRFVVSVAKHYQNQGLSLNDLINEGNIGLIKAATKFDATRGFKFISYAVWWIRQSIMQALMEQPRIVRLPMNKATVYSKISKVSSDFEQENEREPSSEELADILEMKPEELHSLRSCLNFHVSVDQPLGDGDDASMVDMMTSDAIPQPDNQLNDDSMKHKFKQVLSVLSKREMEIIEFYYGINNFNQRYNLDEIGDKLELTRERVRQLKDKAIRKIKKSASQRDLLAFLS